MEATVLLKKMHFEVSRGLCCFLLTGRGENLGGVCSNTDMWGGREGNVNEAKH